MPQKPHNVTIKGTKDGLVFVLDDTCSYDDLLAELQEKLSIDGNTISRGRVAEVKLKTGNRFLTEHQREQIQDVLLKKKNLVVDCIDADVVSKEEAEAIAKQGRMTTLRQTVRSGQLLETTGDLLLVGNVHSGASVKATGNVYVMGELEGTAYAGCEGNTKSFVVASVMKPTKLQIADLVCLGSDVSYDTEEVGCAFIDQGQNKVIVDSLQSLYHMGDD